MIDGELDARWIGAVYRKPLWHFHRQLLRRYGIVLAPGEFSGIKRDLRNGRALLVERRPDDNAIYSVRIASAGERVYVLVHGKEIVTAWPPQRRLNDIRRQRIAADSVTADNDLTAGNDGKAVPQPEKD